MLLRKQAVICSYIFPLHLINGSTLPCETENTEIVSFHVNVTLHVDLPIDTQVTSELSPDNCWTIFYS